MPAPDFRLHHGNDLDVLAGILAAELAKPPPGGALLAPDTVLIPQPAMRRWLQKTLAENHGIAANLRFLTPGEFVRETLAANLGDDDAPVADAGTLRWRLWAILVDDVAMAAPVFAPLRPVLAGDDRALSAWALAGELAQAFEKYQAWRRDWLLRWDADLPADRGDWQGELWRRATRGLSHRARRLDQYLRRFDDARAAPPQGLPPRLFAFACQNVSPDVLRVIASAALAAPLHFFFVSPVEGWWGDLQTAGERLRARPGAVFADDGENPLLRANGAAGRDFVNLLFADERIRPTWEQAVYVPPDPLERTGLLHDLQRDLLWRRPPSTRRAFDAADRSLRLHACPTPLREVQVLHDQLRDLLESDPTLQPRDIAVLTPDIDAWAPLVHGVFGAAMGTPLQIPYAIADGSVLAAQPLPAWFLQVLALPRARFTLAEGLDLLSLPPVARRLGLGPAAIDRLADALRVAGVRWGRDGAHRARAGAGDDGSYTWRWALDRLLLGHATASDADQAGAAPLPWLEGGDIAALDGLIAGLQVLERFAADLQRPLPADAWAARLSDLLDALLPARAADAGERRAFEALRGVVGAFAKELGAAGITRAVDATVVEAWFRDRLGEDDGRQPFLSGGVTFGRMVPMRLIPFRVICLVGMDDGAYPRRDPGGQLNRLAAELRGPHRRTGDRSVREDDRFLFLQLLAAATDTFHVSWQGSDPRSGEDTPPAVVVAELVEIAGRHLDGADDAARLVLRHPLQPFSPAAFGAPLAGDVVPADAARRIGHATAWRPAARVGDGVRAAPPPFLVEALPPVSLDTPVTTRAALFATLANPAKHFLRQRLALRLPQPDDPLPDSEPFAADDFRLKHARAQRVFEALRAGHDDLPALADRLVAEALLPAGPAGRELLRETQARVAGCARAARLWAPDAARTRAWRLDVPEAQLSGTFTGEHDAGLLQFRASRPHGRTLLDLGIDWLAWHGLGERRPVYRLLPGEAPRTLPVLDPAVARSVLREYLRIAWEAARRPLPFLPRSAHAWRAAAGDAPADDGEKAWDAASAEWRGTGKRGTYAEGDDAWVRLALRGNDPFADDVPAARAEFMQLANTVFGPLLRDPEASDG